MKQAKLFYLLTLLLIGLFNCSIFEEKESIKFFTFHNTLGGGGIDVARDVIELDRGYLIVGAAGPECDIIDAASLLLDKETGQVIQFNNFGQSGQFNEDNFHDVEKLSDNLFVAVGFSAPKIKQVPYDTCLLCKVYDEDYSIELNNTCFPDSTISPNPYPDPDGNVFIALFDTLLNKVGSEFHLQSKNTGSRWDAAYNLSIRDDNFYIAGAWHAFNSIIITNNKGEIMDSIVSQNFIGENRDIDLNDENGAFVITGFVHCSDNLPCACTSGESMVMFAKWNNSVLQEYCYELENGAVAASGESISSIESGGYLITGYARDSMGIDHILLMRIDEDGNKLWAKTFEAKGSALDISKDAVERGNGFVLTGDTGDDLFIMSIDENGNENWKETYSIGSKQSGKAIIATSDGGFLVVGNSFNADGSSSTMYVIKTDARGKVN